MLLGSGQNYVSDQFDDRQVSVGIRASIQQHFQNLHKYDQVTALQADIEVESEKGALGVPRSILRFEMIGNRDDGFGSGI